MNNSVLCLSSLLSDDTVCIKRKTISNKVLIVFIACIIVLLAAIQASSLEQLSEDEMDSVSGQFGSVMMDPMMTPQLGIEPENLIGMSIITSPALITHTQNSLRFTPSAGYLQFDNVTASLGISSVWHTSARTGFNNPITFTSSGIDEPDTLFTDTWLTGTQDYYIENPLNGKTIMSIDAAESILTFNFAATDMVFNDESMGSFDIVDFQLTENQAELLAIDGTTHMAIQTAIDVGEINYNHDVENIIDPVNSFKITGLMAAEKFQISGVDDILPSYLSTVSPGDEVTSDAWTGTGTFKVGTGNRTPVLSFADDPLIQQGAPTAYLDPFAYASIDIAGDTEPYIRHRYYIRTDSGLDMDNIYEIDPDGSVGDGVTYPYVANPRLNKSYIKARLPFEGSIRAAHITDYGPQDTSTSTWGDVDTGPAAIDGIRSISNVEAPGYGYGNTWDSLPYDESKYQ